jgi:hypothetical protein
MRIPTPLEAPVTNTFDLSAAIEMILSVTVKRI